MAETKAAQRGRVLPFESDGWVSGTMSHAAELAEKSLTSVFQAAREIGGEVHVRYNATVDFADTSAQGVAKVFRNVGSHVHSVFDAVADTGENVSVSFVRTLRNLGHDLTGLASKATGTIVRNPDERVARAA